MCPQESGYGHLLDLFPGETVLAEVTNREMGKAIG